MDQSSNTLVLYIAVCNFFFPIVEPKIRKTDGAGKKSTKQKTIVDRSKSDSHAPPPYAANQVPVDSAEQQFLQTKDEWQSFDNTYPNTMPRKKVKRMTQPGLNLQQQQFLLQQHWKDKDVMDNQQRKILEQKRIISEQQRQIMQQNETHRFFQEQINNLQQQVNTLTNQNQRLGVDFSSKSPPGLLVRSPLGVPSPQSSSSSSHGSGPTTFDIPYSHSPTVMTSNRGFPLEYATRGIPPPYSTCPPPYHSNRPTITDSSGQLGVAMNTGGMMDGNLLGGMAGLPPSQMIQPAQMMPQQNLMVPGLQPQQQPTIAVSVASPPGHHYPLPGSVPPAKGKSPTPSPSGMSDKNATFFPAKVSPANNATLPVPSTSANTSHSPKEKPDASSFHFDPIEFQKFADNEVNKLSEHLDTTSSTSVTADDSEIWQLSLPSLGVAMGYGVGGTTDESKPLDPINTNKDQCKRYAEHFFCYTAYGSNTALLWFPIENCNWP